MIACRIWWIPLLFVTLATVVPTNACRATKTAESETMTILRQFAKDWPDDRTTYRIEGDTSWIAYAMTLRRLVSMGDEAVPGLIAGSEDSSTQVRALCARVLGLLGAKPAVPRLIELLSDDSALVALLAADALGQIQDPAGLEALRVARVQHENGDVLLHINKSLDRAVQLEDGVRKQILQINAKTVNSAKVGQLAPEFTLQDATGKVWRLADFRGQKTVVLVFIYGDG